MADGDIEITAGASGSDVVLSSDEVFEVTTGRVAFSTDSGTTYMEWGPGDGKVVFASGLTVKVKNTRAVDAAFRHMPI